MRYIYNCVKLVLLIAGLCFAGQSSAAKPVKLDYVEIGGLQFKLQEGELVFRFAGDVQKYVKTDYKGADFHDAKMNIFLQGIDNSAVFKDSRSGEVDDDFLKCPLAYWVGKCCGGHEYRAVRGRQVQNAKVSQFDVSLLCQSFADSLLDKLSVGDSCFEWKAGGCSFFLTKVGGFKVKEGSNDEIGLRDYLSGTGDLKVICNCTHGVGIRGRQKVAYVFLNVSSVIEKLTPLVKALTSDQEFERGTSGNAGGNTSGNAGGASNGNAGGASGNAGGASNGNAGGASNGNAGGDEIDFTGFANIFPEKKN